MLKLINTATGEILGSITTNRSLTLEEVIDLLCGDILPEAEEENVWFADEGFYYEDLDLVKA